jgi:hypothetical protein
MGVRLFSNVSEQLPSKITQHWLSSLYARWHSQFNTLQLEIYLLICTVYITPIWLLCWTADQSAWRRQQSAQCRSIRAIIGDPLGLRSLLENNSPSLFIFRASVRDLLVLPSAFKQIDPDSLNKHTGVLCGVSHRRNCTIFFYFWCCGESFRTPAPPKDEAQIRCRFRFPK